jgi:hypothetical protein
VVHKKTQFDTLAEAAWFQVENALYLSRGCTIFNYRLFDTSKESKGWIIFKHRLDNSSAEHLRYLTKSCIIFRHRQDDNSAEAS